MLNVLRLGFLLALLGLALPTQAEQLTIVSLNFAMSTSGHRRERLEAFARTIEERKPDVVALQEFYFSVADLPVVTQLRKLLGAHYDLHLGIPPSGKFENTKLPFRPLASGLAWLVRKDVTIESRHAEKWRQNFLIDLFTQKGFFHLAIKKDQGRRIHVINAHLNPFFPGKNLADLLKKYLQGVKQAPKDLGLDEIIKRTQIDQVAAYIKALPQGEPVFLMGDLNIISTREYPDHPFLSLPQHNLYAYLVKALDMSDTWATVHESPEDKGFTYDPAHNPLAIPVPDQFKLMFPMPFRGSYLFAKLAGTGVDSAAMELLFDQPIKLKANKTTFLSDHYGLLASFSY